MHQVMEEQLKVLESYPTIYPRGLGSTLAVLGTSYHGVRLYHILLSSFLVNSSFPVTGLESTYQIHQVLAANTRIGGDYQHDDQMSYILAMFNIRLIHHHRDSLSFPFVFVIC